MAAKKEQKTKIRIKLSSYDYRKLNDSVSNIVQTIKKTGVALRGPIALPNKTKRFCVLKSPHVDKDAREHFKLCTHSRIIEILRPDPGSLDALMKLNLSSGVMVKIFVENTAEEA
ncbi:MAG: 30S ribosomal protein S10 [Legionellales bacterium]|nr:30S ribosomal protein S10 [Legionellales bacterium]|tara:strand:- start:1728 stop:2072 length:345 start_codon:yes stop_codon:yes gene_type:complete